MLKKTSSAEDIWSLYLVAAGRHESPEELLELLICQLDSTQFTIFILFMFIQFLSLTSRV